MTTHFIKGYINQLVKFGAFSTVWQWTKQDGGRHPACQCHGSNITLCCI